MPSANNYVVEVYRGITIRHSNVVQLRVGSVLFKMLILESERTGLPISKILSASSKPCARCSDIDVVVYNKAGDELKIKRGILSRHMPEGQGASIIQQHAKKL